MKIQIPLLILALTFCKFSAQGQTAWFAADTLSQVRKDGRDLLSPWAGGLNAVQYAKMDLDRDGVEDLVLFDRTTSKVSTFLADAANGRFVYRQEYESLFPPITNWMILADYNNDGKKELFAHISYGATVYRQVDDGSGGWKWENIKEYLTVRGVTGNMVNLYVVASDIPALVDIDDDGDLDIITFESGGDFLELNQNMSMERYGVPDSLEFVRNGQCWGDFRKHTCDDFDFGVNCGVVVADNARVKHAGNALVLHDLNGDGRKDMLLGNVDCENLNIVFNSSPGLVGQYTSFQSNYPETDPAVMSIFPAPYLEDVDFDGVKDLLVSPNVYGNDNLEMDFISSGWYYHNAGSDNLPDFQLRQKDFLQGEMVDVGENAAASFFDVDGDGDADLIIGNRGRYNGTDFRGSLWLYKNNGTASQPVYELDTDDFLGLAAAMGHTDLQPQWVDFNGDGRIDLGLATIQNRRLRYHYFPNQAGAGQPAQLSAGSRVEIQLPAELSVSDRVFFIDQDKDGDPDLLVGGVLGNISYYENTGTATQPNFVLRDAALGGMGPAFSRRYLSLAAADIDLDGKTDILTVDQNGRVTILYDGDWGQWTKKDTSVVLNKETGRHYAPFFGTRLHATVADINGDQKPDVAIGTAGGGVYLFRNILPVEVTGNEPRGELLVYPNPARKTFSVKAPESGPFEVFDMLGKKMAAGYATVGVGHEVNVSNWAGGVYLVRFNGPGSVRVKKVIVAGL